MSSQQSDLGAALQVGEGHSPADLLHQSTPERSAVNHLGWAEILHLPLSLVGTLRVQEKVGSAVSLTTPSPILRMQVCAWTQDICTDVQEG